MLENPDNLRIGRARPAVATIREALPSAGRPWPKLGGGKRRGKQIISEKRNI
jgi:hypothetical protein